MERPVSYHNGVPWSPSKPGKAYRRFKKVVLVDSRDRIFPSIANPSPSFSVPGAGTPKVVTNQYGDLLPLNNDYYVQLPNPYKNVYGVRLLTAEIPTSFYVFNSVSPNGTALSLNPASANYYKNCVGGNPNGILYIDYNGTVYQVTLPNGNYSLTDAASPLAAGTLQAALKTALEAATSGPGGAFTVTIDPNTQQITIVETNGVTFTLLFTYDSNNYVLPSNTFWGLGYLLGFQKTNVASVTDGGTEVVVGSYPIQVNPYNYILMELDFINKMDESSLENQRGGSTDSVYAKIPLNGNSFSYVFFSTNSNYDVRSVMTPPLNKLQTIHVKFRHHDGTLVNFNNVDHSFTLELELLDTNFDEWSSLETSLADPLALEGRRFNA